MTVAANWGHIGVSKALESRCGGILTEPPLTSVGQNEKSSLTDQRGHGPHLLKDLKLSVWEQQVRSNGKQLVVPGCVNLGVNPGAKEGAKSAAPDVLDLGSPGNGSSQATDLRIRRQHSSDSVSSINSATSHSSVGSNIETDSKKKKRKNWVSVPPKTVMPTNRVGLGNSVPRI